MNSIDAKGSPGKNELELHDKYLALAAAHALLKYFEFTTKVTLAPASMKITYRPLDGHVLIDCSSIINLELSAFNELTVAFAFEQRVPISAISLLWPALRRVRNYRTGATAGSLFGLLNRTKTPMGARLLRATLIQPSCEIFTLNTRYDAISELQAGGHQLFFSLQSALSKAEALI